MKPLASETRGGHNRKEARSSEVKRDQARSSEVIVACHRYQQRNRRVSTTSFMEWRKQRGEEPSRSSRDRISAGYKTSQRSQAVIEHDIRC